MKNRKDIAIRIALVAVGVSLIVFSARSGRTLPMIGGAMATLAGLLGPHRMGELNTAVLLTLVYVIGIGPMGLIGRLRGDSPLDAPAGDRYWRAKPAPNPAMDPRRRIRFQF